MHKNDATNDGQSQMCYDEDDNCTVQEEIPYGEDIYDDRYQRQYYPNQDEDYQMRYADEDPYSQ